jgi:hypothetical protein
MKIRFSVLYNKETLFSLNHRGGTNKMSRKKATIEDKFQVRERQKTIEQGILTALMYNEEYVARIARVNPPWDCFRSSTVCWIAQQAIGYFANHGSVGCDMEGPSSPGDSYVHNKKLRESINNTLVVIDEKAYLSYGVDVNILVEKTFEYFHQCQARNLVEEENKALAKNDIVKFYKIQKTFKPVNIADVFGGAPSFCDE